MNVNHKAHLLNRFVHCFLFQESVRFGLAAQWSRTPLNRKLCSSFCVLWFLLLAYLLRSSLAVKCIQVYSRAQRFFSSLSLNFQQPFNAAWWLFFLIVYIDIQWTMWNTASEKKMQTEIDFDGENRLSAKIRCIRQRQRIETLSSVTWNARTSNTQIFPVAFVQKYPHKSKICVTKCSIVDACVFFFCFTVHRECCTADMPSVSFDDILFKFLYFVGPFFRFSHKLMARLRLLSMAEYTQLMNSPMWIYRRWFQFLAWHRGPSLSYFTNFADCIRHLYFLHRNQTQCAGISPANKCFNCKSSSFRLFQYFSQSHILFVKHFMLLYSQCLFWIRNTYFAVDSTHTNTHTRTRYANHYKSVTHKSDKKNIRYHFEQCNRSNKINFSNCFFFLSSLILLFQPTKYTDAVNSLFVRNVNKSYMLLLLLQVILNAFVCFIFDSCVFYLV